MGIDIYTKDEHTPYAKFILVCNTIDEAFTGVYYGTYADAVNFLNWLDLDARAYSESELSRLYNKWREENE